MADFEMYKGDNITFNLSVTLSGEAYVLTDCSLIFTVKHSFADPDSSAIIQKTSADITEIDINAPLTGGAVIFIVPADTEDLTVYPDQEFVYDVELTTKAGEVRTAARGTFGISDEASGGVSYGYQSVYTTKGFVASFSIYLSPQNVLDSIMEAGETYLTNYLLQDGRLTQPGIDASDSSLKLAATYFVLWFGQKTGTTESGFFGESGEISGKGAGGLSLSFSPGRGSRRHARTMMDQGEDEAPDWYALGQRTVNMYLQRHPAAKLGFGVTPEIYSTERTSEEDDVYRVTPRSSW